MFETFFLVVILAAAICFSLRVLGGKKNNVSTISKPELRWALVPPQQETEGEKNKKEVKKLFELADDIANYFGHVLSSQYYGSPWGNVHTSRYEVAVGGNKFALYHNCGKDICLVSPTGEETELGEQVLIDSGVMGSLTEALERELAGLTEAREKQRREEDLSRAQAALLREKEELEARRAQVALLQKTFSTT